MKRKIIVVNEEKCTGCGECVQGCPEGALQIVDGKARLVGDLLCDGLGACIGTCPEGAITIEEREAVPYDENKVMDNIVKGGESLIGAHLKHLSDHGQTEFLQQARQYLKDRNIPEPQQPSAPAVHAGCPGQMAKNLRGKASGAPGSGAALRSELGQWPIQLHLLNPLAPYFNDADLVVVADCVPFSFANFHDRFLKGKILIVFCPKLDQSTEKYIEKLKNILQQHNIRSITTVHMEVPCCSATVKIVEDAVRQSGKTVIIKEHTISLDGHII